MIYNNSNQLWYGAKFKSSTQPISELDSNIYLVSQLLNSFDSNTTYSQLVYNSENFNNLDIIFKNIGTVSKDRQVNVTLGTEQIISELSQGYFVNKSQPIVGENPVLGLEINNTIFTWGYNSTSRPEVKNIQSESSYVANVPFNHIATGFGIKLGVEVIAKEDITTALNFNVNLYRQVLDIEGRVEKTLISTLGTVIVDGTVDTEQTVSIRQGHYAQSFVNLSIAGQTDSGASAGGGAAEGGVRPEIGLRTNSSSLNIGSFTNLDINEDDPIKFLETLKKTSSDFTVSGTPASSVSYFISLENVDEVTSNGTGIVLVVTELLTPGGGTHPWCESPIFAGHVYNGAGSSIIHYAFNCNNWLTPD